ncbi:MAG: DUF5320 domain-containing protein [Candidatus Hodarchaeaceae archaeon]|nr:DUF5320 domain-containing protein [Candidatus Hodarchaeaceae archaeon]
MAETRVVVWSRSVLVALRTLGVVDVRIPMEWIPRNLRVCSVRDATVPLPKIRTIPLSGILVNKQKEVKSMWWPRGWRCWWWYMNPYMYPPYLPYVQAPQQPSQPAPQPTQPATVPYYPLPPFMPPPPTPEQEIEALEAYKSELEEELKGIEARIKELRESLGKGSSGQPSETGK